MYRETKIMTTAGFTEVTQLEKTETNERWKSGEHF